MMRRRPPPMLSVNVAPAVTAQSVRVDNMGVLRAGAVQIGPTGLLVDGQTPKNSPYPARANSVGAPPTGTPLAVLRLEDLQQGVTLGSGAAGVVKKCVHKVSGRTLALKIVKLSLEVDEPTRRMTLGELQALHKIQSPQIVEFYDAFLSDGCIHIALEFMDAGSLRDALKRGAISEPHLGRIAFMILSGLSYLHKSHLIHRDLKPDNVLINTRGEVKIADFGVSGLNNRTLQTCHSMIGTATYMSPERIEAKPYRIDSDIWSFGVVVLECAIGKYPYGDRPSSAARLRPLSPPGVQQPSPGGGGVSADLKVVEMLGRIVREQPPQLPRQTFPETLCQFVALCLQKAPENRPSASQLLSHPWMVSTLRADVDMAAWARGLKGELDI